jgi:outer membrane protein OmpA-like peptidoglycan-associated protein
MSAERRRTLRAVLSVLLLTGGILLALSIDRGTPGNGVEGHSATVLDAPEFSIRLGRSTLVLEGTTISDEHEAALLQLVSDQFDGVDTQTDFRPGLIIRPDWEALSTRLLYLVAATESANASISASGISIRGVTIDAPSYQNRLAFLQTALPEGTTVDADVLVISDSVSLEELCNRNFANLMSTQISFRQSSTSIRQSSYPLLDRLVEFAYECRGRQIAITGHSDATGDTVWTLQISHARAQAVADHLIHGGLSAERLIVEGLGSQQPIADNDTVHGRELNRRIEIELR